MVKAITEWVRAVQVATDIDKATAKLRAFEQQHPIVQPHVIRNFQKKMDKLQSWVADASPEVMLIILDDYRDALTDVKMMDFTFGKNDDFITGDIAIDRESLLGLLDETNLAAQKDAELLDQDVSKIQQEIKDLNAKSTHGVQGNFGRDISKKFPLDLKGSRFDTPQIRKMLDANGTWDSIQVTITIAMPWSGGGSWDPKEREMTVLADVGLNTVRHELQHMVQSMLDSIIPKGKGGMPSRSLMTPQYNQSANRDYRNLEHHDFGHETPDALQTHALDDREFYTVLSDIIDNIKEWVERGHADASEQRSKILDLMGVGGGRPDPRMQAWKRFAPGKYRKAIKEFYRAFPILSQDTTAKKVAARWIQSKVDDSAQFRKDVANRAKHIVAAKSAFKALLVKLRPLADKTEAAFPDKSPESIARRGRLFSAEAKTNPDMMEFLAKYIGTDDQDEKAYSWRGAIIYQARDVLIGGKSIKDALVEVEKQADKGFEAIAMAEAQAPVRSVIPAELREYLPKKIVVTVDAKGNIQRVTDRFENESFTLGVKIEHMREIVRDYNSIVKKVKMDLGSQDEITKLAALITSIIMETGIRPGQEGNAAVKTINGEKVEVETFGAITLGPNHIRFVRDNFAELEFIGKKGGTNIATLSDTTIIKVLDHYVKNALTKGSKFVFVTEAGVTFTYTDLQRYFRLNFAGLNPTDFRKLKATETLLGALRSEQASLYTRIKAFAGAAVTDLRERIVNEIVATMNRAIEKAQQALSHDDAATTIRSYINPEIIFKFLANGRVDDTLREAILDGHQRLAFDPAVFMQQAMAKGASIRTATLRDLLEQLESEMS
jgi:hypothetical protein